jgi:hypothetical protein
MGEICSSGTSVEFQRTTWDYILEVSTLQNVLFLYCVALLVNILFRENIAAYSESKTDLTNKLCERSVVLYNVQVRGAHSYHDPLMLHSK